MRPLVLSHSTLVTALGHGTRATFDSLLAGRSGLRPCRFLDCALDTHVGEIEGLDENPMTGPLAAFDCRNNRLAQMTLRQDGFEQAINDAKRRLGANRIALVLGTSTSGIQETESAYARRDAATGTLPADFRYRETHDAFSVVDFTHNYLGLGGPALCISTACSSSSKVFASAARMIEAGFCDAAIVGGIDSLCFTTLYGFSSLELVAPRPCRPADADRDGISIGEGAGFALLERHGADTPDDAICLLGYGESSDAHHMSAPHPEGLGAVLAMEAALARAGLKPADIDYVNLHGTASRSNDAAEDKAITRVFGGQTPCSSTKGWTGHTLGAAGITGALIAGLCIRESWMPQSLNTDRVDPTFTSLILTEPRRQPVRRVMVNTFAFGGSNCSLVLGRAAP